MSRRGMQLALAMFAVFGISLGFVSTVAYHLGESRSKTVNIYYPVPAPAPIATDVPPPPKQWVPM